MRSRAARLTLSTVAMIAAAAAAFFIAQSEKQMSARRQGVRAFDHQARQVAERLGDLRAAQQAYVAQGQGAAFWMPKVAALLEDVVAELDTLRTSSESSNGRALLMESAASVTEFGNVDHRAREYLTSGQPLMAGDVVFTEGGETAANAARLIESARLAELQDVDAFEATLRRREAAALAGAGGIALLSLLALALAAPRQPRAEATLEHEDTNRLATGELMLRDASRPSRSTIPATTSAPRGSVPLLKAAAELCTEFGRVNDREDLPRLMARAADVLDASGLIAWVGDVSGAALRPVLAHGYPDSVLARMPAVARSADNAAAAAYRTGKLQIVMKRPGVSNGAVVAPLLSPDGCIGALTAEIVAGSETSEGVQAIAALLAAQITTIVAGLAVSELRAETSTNRIASA